MNWINRTLESGLRSATSVYPTLRHIARARLRYGRDELLDAIGDRLLEPLHPGLDVEMIQDAPGSCVQWRAGRSRPPVLLRHTHTAPRESEALDPGVSPARGLSCGRGD